MTTGGDDNEDGAKAYALRPDLVRKRMIVSIVFTVAMVAAAFLSAWIRL